MTATKPEPWHRVFRLKEELRSGELTLAEFAADLHEVTLGEGRRPIYEDPARFFALTFPTPALRELVKDVAERPAGRSAKAVRQLELTYGGGKTHTLIPLYHLFRDPAALSEAKAVQEFRQHVGRALPRAFTVSLCSDKIDVERGIDRVRAPEDVLTDAARLQARPGRVPRRVGAGSGAGSARREPRRPPGPGSRRPRARLSRGERRLPAGVPDPGGPDRRPGRGPRQGRGTHRGPAEDRRWRPVLTFAARMRSKPAYGTLAGPSKHRPRALSVSHCHRECRAGSEIFSPWGRRCSRVWGRFEGLLGGFHPTAGKGGRLTSGR